MGEGSVLHADHGDIHILRFIGEIRYTLAPSLEQFVQHLFIDFLPAGFVIDLTEAKMIDSTNLGLLARLAQRMLPQKTTLICGRDDITEVLDSMGFDAIFDIVDCAGAPASEQGNEVSRVETDSETLRATMLDAHRTLMALNESNRAMFQDVVSELEKDDPSEH